MKFVVHIERSKNYFYLPVHNTMSFCEEGDAGMENMYVSNDVLHIDTILYV